MKFIGISFIAFLAEHLLIGTEGNRNQIGIEIGADIDLKKTCGLKEGDKVIFEINELLPMSGLTIKSTIKYRVDPRDDYSFTLRKIEIKVRSTDEVPTNTVHNYPINLYGKTGSTRFNG